MKKLDLSYLCSTIGSLCGFPVRLYEGDKLVFKVNHSGLKYDPMVSFQEDLFALTEHVGTYITPRYYFYGVVRSDEVRLIMGPTRQLPATEQQLRELAFMSNVPSDDTNDFIQAMRSLVPMPLESLQQILCTMNYVINGEKLSLEDIAGVTDIGLRRMVRRRIWSWFEQEGYSDIKKSDIEDYVEEIDPSEFKYSIRDDGTVCLIIDQTAPFFEDRQEILEIPLDTEPSD